MVPVCACNDDILAALCCDVSIMYDVLNMFLLHMTGRKRKPDYYGPTRCNCF